MQRLKQDKDFFAFLKLGGAPVRIGVLLALALVLILLAGLGDGATREETAGEEERIAEICSLTEGAGECRVMVTYRENDGESVVYAVAVICEGADSSAVRGRLTSLICSLYGIGAHRVEILKLED